MRKLQYPLVLTILSFGLLTTGVANADPIRVDQLSPITGGGQGCCGGADLAQTFTVGITGILRTVALPLSTPDVRGLSDDFSGQLGIQIRPTLAGVPSASVLAETILSKSSLPSVNTPGVRFEFTTLFSGLNIPIVEGTQLAIVLSNVGHNGQNIRWALDGTASYTGGAAYRQAREDTGIDGDQGPVIGPWFADPNPFDFAFFTLVEAPAIVAPTPEPGTVLLLGTGILWLARRGRTGAGAERT